MACIKNIIASLSIVLLSSASMAQIVTSGKITYMRRTNLKKTVGDNPRVKDMINEKNKIRKESFELFFNDSSSVYKYIEPEEEESSGFLKYFTTRNTFYQNQADNEKLIILDLWGTPAYLNDTMSSRVWKVTDSKRKIAGHMCRKAVWEVNDSTTWYAWYAPNIVSSTGPEMFNGLPGAILGVAIENGSVVYFAEEVKAMEVKDELMDYSKFKKDAYSKAELKEVLREKMGKWIDDKTLDAMFIML